MTTLAAKMSRTETLHAATLIETELHEIIDRHFGDTALNWHGFVVSKLEQTPPIEAWLTELERAVMASHRKPEPDVPPCTCGGQGICTMCQLAANGHSVRVAP